MMKKFTEQENLKICSEKRKIDIKTEQDLSIYQNPSKKSKKHLNKKY